MQEINKKSLQKKKKKKKIKQSLMFIRQMLLNPKHRDNVKDIVLFIVCKIYFPMVLYRIIRLEGINKYSTLKKVLRHPWNALTLQVSLSARDR